MKNKMLRIELIVAFIVIGIVSAVFAANSVTTTPPGRVDPGPIPAGQVYKMKLTGIMNTANTNVPSDSGVDVQYLFNYGWCDIEREGTVDLTITPQKGNLPGTSATVLFTNSSNGEVINTTNPEATYSFVWADEPGRYFRLNLGTGFDSTNQIINASCYFKFTD